MIEITKDLLVGVPIIDEQHKGIIDRLNSITAMGFKSFSKEENEKTIEFLGNYIDSHFKDEEELHLQTNYPKYEWHKALHADFHADFQKLKDDYHKNGTSVQLTTKLQSFIIDWFIKHIKTIDVQFGKYYNEQNINNIPK